MASWSEDIRHLPESINGGQKYEQKDRVSRQDLNAMVENSLYAASKVDMAKTNSEQAINAASEVLATAQSKASSKYVDDSIAAAIKNTWEANY